MRSKRVHKVLVGLSGGVDSSVAAALLQQKGNEVIGVTMEIFDSSVPVKESGRHACYGPGEKEDCESAASVCRKLDIPFYKIDLRKEYREHVIGYFKTEYLAGRTPNPCVVCNQRLKFGFLLEKAREEAIDFDFFATGHYARIRKSKERYLLQKGVDPTKDQTYFLYAIRPELLAHLTFPLGGYMKQQVREIARSLRLETAHRSESQDFISGGDYSPIFGEEETQTGDIVDERGNILGRHRGIIHYTVGQRRGLGIASRRPLYVLKIDTASNRIVVGGKEKLFSKGLIASNLNLLAIDCLDRPYNAEVKIRLKHSGAKATILPYENDKAKVLFEEPQMSVTPGQSVAFYSKDTVLGGGIIEQGL